MDEPACVLDSLDMGCGAGTENDGSDQANFELSTWCDTQAPSLLLEHFEMVAAKASDVHPR